MTPGRNCSTNDIRAFEQRVEPPAHGGIFQVEGDAALAAIEKCEARAVAPPTGRMAAHLLAASQRLDLDDLGAGLGQEQRRQWARQQSREVEDKQTFERPHRAFPYSDEQVASSPD